MRFLKNYKGEPIKVQPKRFLDTAAKAQDPNVFHTVFNHFHRNESDHTWKQFVPVYEQMFLSGVNGPDPASLAAGDKRGSESEGDGDLNFHYDGTEERTELTNNGS